MPQDERSRLDGESQEFSERTDEDMEATLDTREAEKLKEEEEMAELDSLGRSP